MKALIVDDNKTSSGLLRGLLAPYANSDIAENGSDAFEHFRRGVEKGEPYAVVFLDIMMPSADGHAVLKSIRSYERERGVPEPDSVRVIMVSALDDPNNVVSAFHGGCEGYLVKPIRKGELEDQLKRLRLIGVH